MPIRTTHVATVESGRVTEAARLELPEKHLWLYPQADGKVRVEMEDKSIDELLNQ